MKRSCFGLCLCLALVPFSVAEKPTPEEIAAEVRRLGHDRFEEREQAAKKLWQAGKAAEAALKEAVKSDDPEVRDRAMTILRDFEWGVYPDTPADLAEQIKRYRDGDEFGKRQALRVLLEKGSKGFEVITSFLERDKEAKIAEHEKTATLLREQIVYGLTAQLADKNDKAVEKLFEIGLTQSNPDLCNQFAAYKFLTGKAEDTIKKLTTQIDNDRTGNSVSILIGLYRLKGELDKARDLATNKQRQELLPILERQQKRWKQLAEDLNRNTVHGASLRAAYLRIAKADKEAEEADDELAKMAADFAKGDPQLWVIGRNLCLLGKPKEGMRIAGKGTGRIEYLQLLILQQRFGEARELIDKAEKEKDADPRLQIHSARLHIMTGDRDKGIQTFQKIVDEVTEESAPDVMAQLIEAEIRIGMPELAREHTAALIDPLEAENILPSIARSVFYGQEMHVMVLWRILRDRMDKADTKEVAAKLDAMLRGTIDAKEVDELCDAADEGFKGKDAHTRQLLQQTLGELCLRAGRDERAKKYFEVADPRRLGDWYSDKEQWKEAAEWYGKAWEKDRSKPVALILRGWALEQSGNKDAAQEDYKLADLVLLARVYERCQILDDLLERGALTPIEQQVERIQAMGEFYYVNHTLRALTRYHLRKKNYLKAADCLEQSLIDLYAPEASIWAAESLLLWPSMIHQMRAQGHLAAGNKDAALKSARKAHDFGLGNVDLTIHLVREFDQAGHKDEAKALFEESFDPLVKLCKEYPKSAHLHNSLAWLGARCGRQLEKSLDHAKQAVALAPKNASILDTLAEVHFQLGEQDKAVETMKKCIELEPHRDFFKKQLERYKKGDKSAEIPEFR